MFLHATTVTALDNYRQRRDRWCPHRAGPSVFVLTRSTRLDAHNLSHTSLVLDLSLSNRVCATTPAAGTRLPSGSTVDITLGTWNGGHH